MRAFPAAAAAAALCLVTPAVALADDDPVAGAEPALTQLSEKLADPEFQEQASAIASALVGSLLELEVGPIAEAMDKATDGKGPDIDPDARLRDLAPDAEELPEQLAERLPEAMNAMSAMTDGMQDMLPALREMAKKMRGAMEGARADR